MNILELGSPFGISLVAISNSLLSDFRGILELVLGESSGFLEEGVVNVGLDTVNGHLGGGGNHVGGVDSSKGNSVNGVRASDENIS